VEWWDAFFVPQKPETITEQSAVNEKESDEK